MPPLTPIPSHEIRNARLTIDAYRAPLTRALAQAGRPTAITSDGSLQGFDAVVVTTMDKKAYSVTVTETAVLVRAGHYLALEAAFRKILSGRGLDGQSFTGEYRGSVPLTREDPVHGDMVLVWNEEFEGSSWKPSQVTDQTPFPIEYRIDWVRLYQTPDTGVLHYDGYRE